LQSDATQCRIDNGDAAADVEMSHNVLACAVCYKFIPHDDARYITTGCFSRTPTLDAERDLN